MRESRGGRGAPRPLGIDEHGREILTFLDGETVGNARPWPSWVYADDTLDRAARWMREFHEAVAGFVPPPDAVWREGGHWSEGLIIGHNDAAPYNAAWRAGRLTGFFDWDYAGPVTREWDLAFAAFGWVPLHARHVVAPQGFTAFETRAERLRRFLGAYGWDGSAAELLNVVKARISAHADGIRRLAAAGEAAFVRLRDQGVPVDLERALAELDALRF